jgi:hypothetical protein
MAIGRVQRRSDLRTSKHNGVRTGQDRSMVDMTPILNVVTKFSRKVSRAEIQFQQNPIRARQVRSVDF